MKIALVGATGLVGGVMRKVLEERGFGNCEFVPAASSKSEGKIVTFAGKECKIVSVEEAIEEANFVLELIEDYNVTLPVVFDWERMDFADSRTVKHDAAVLNDCAVAFCETVKQAGYEPAVYFNKHFGYYEFDLQRLCGYKLWLAQPDNAPDFYYAFDIWQSSFTAEVKGIDCETDLDILFIPLPDEDTEQNENGHD